MEEQKQSKPKKNGIDEEEKDTLDSECSTNYAQLLLPQNSF